MAIAGCRAIFFILKIICIQFQETMHCRNYMEQYSRTKSIREINKNRNSYKLLTQHSKLLANNNLKLSQTKNNDHYHSNHNTDITKHKINEVMAHQTIVNKQSLHIGNKYNRDSFANIRESSCLKELSSKVKMKTSIGQRSSKSIAQYDRVLTKHPKIIGHSKKNSQQNGVLKNNKSISISSISKSKAHLESIGQTLPNTQYSTAKKNTLEDLYERMKKVMQEHERKEKQWSKQKKSYEKKIEGLQKQLQSARKKADHTKKSKSKQTNSKNDLHSFRKC